jgi:hypothetical protein
MILIYLPEGFISDDFQKAKAYCEHFNCTIYPAKKGSAENAIYTEEALNLFWMGVNLNLKSTSPLTITPAEKYLGK